MLRGYETEREIEVRRSTQTIGGETLVREREREREREYACVVDEGKRGGKCDRMVSKKEKQH